MGKKKKSKEERRVEKLEKQRSKDKDKEGKEKSKKSKKKKVEDENSEAEEDGQSKSLENSGDATPNEGDSDSWDEDKMEEEKKKKKKEKKKKEEKNEEKKLLHKEVLFFSSPEIADVAGRLRNMIQEKQKVDTNQFFQELRILQVSQDFDAKCRIYVTLSALFKDDLSPSALELKIDFLNRVCDSSVQAHDVLEALEYFCCNDEPSSLPSFPYLIQKLYNADIMEAEDILKYYRKESDLDTFMKCKRLAEPFLEWLEDEDESSQDESAQTPSKLEGSTSTVQTKSLKA